MSLTVTLEKIRAAGFTLAVDGDDLVVTPPGRLSDQQRAFLKAHKAEIIAALTHPEPANDAPIWVQCWTPLGNRMVVRADDQAHAESILHSNPKPPPGGWPK